MQLHSHVSREPTMYVCIFTCTVLSTLDMSHHTETLKMSYDNALHSIRCDVKVAETEVSNETQYAQVHICVLSSDTHVLYVLALI